MYRRPAFERTDLDEAFSMIEERVAGSLVVPSPDGLQASMLPWRLTRGAIGDARLAGHVARGNPLATILDRPTPGVVLFDIVDGYVSPSWYPSEHGRGRAVPTWNYVAVHVHGTLRSIDDPSWLLENVTALTVANEAGFGTPWSVTDAPGEYIAGLLRGIVGIECVIGRVEAKAKLSQDRAPADVDGVIRGLGDREGAGALRDAMVATRQRPG